VRKRDDHPKKEPTKMGTLDTGEEKEGIAGKKKETGGCGMRNR